jgi:rRNA processing protein Krr1/Pno1
MSKTQQYSNDESALYLIEALSLGFSEDESVTLLRQKLR